MNNNIWILLLCLGFSVHAQAHICWNAKGKGVVDELSYDISNSFSSSNNAIGKIVELKKNFSSAVYAVCPKHNSNDSGNMTKRSYMTDLPIVEVIDRYQYLSINSYLIGAVKITDSWSGDYYPPAAYIQMGKHPNVSKGQSFPIKDSNFTFRLKVIKPFIDFVPIPKKTMFIVYVTTGNDPLNIPVYFISYSGHINVPQSCDIGVGDVLELDFGKISANAFVQAGIGNKPIGVNEQTRTLNIQCKNIEAHAALTVRLQAELVSNDSMRSDNPDIGFKVSDQNGALLLPNNINSTIPFRLDSPSVHVTIRAWPVSLTGLAPAIGPFRARGYLRVDFE